MSRLDPEAWAAPEMWRGETCFIVGGGPSLKGFDFGPFYGARFIVVNRAYLVAPWAPVLYFADASWWRVEGRAASACFQGDLIVTSSGVREPADPRLRRMQNTGGTGLDADPRSVRHGTNSGYQAMNLAFHFGVRRIVLLGFDLKTAGPGGATHWHGGYGYSEPVVSHILSERMAPYFRLLAEPLAAAGVEVVNASPDSAINCWPRVEVADAIEYL